MNLVKLLTAACAALLVGCTSLSELKDNQDLAFLRQATWQLTNEFGSCSGVAIAPERVLTAAHCDGPQLKAEGLPAVVLKKNEVADVMLLEVKGLECPCVPIADARPVQDTRVTTIGFPLEVGEVVTEGRLQGNVPIPSNPEFPEEFKARLAHVMIVTSPVIFGNSGGPVFAVEGGVWKVVGVVSAVGVANIGGLIPNVIPHLAYIVNTETIKVFVK